MLNIPGHTWNLYSHICHRAVSLRLHVQTTGYVCFIHGHTVFVLCVWVLIMRKLLVCWKESTTHFLPFQIKCKVDVAQWRQFHCLHWRWDKSKIRRRSGLRQNGWWWWCRYNRSRLPPSQLLPMYGLGADCMLVAVLLGWHSCPSKAHIIQCVIHGQNSDDARPLPIPRPPKVLWSSSLLVASADARHVSSLARSLTYQYPSLCSP